MESLPTLDQIDDEIQQTLQVFKDELGIECETLGLLHCVNDTNQRGSSLFQTTIRHGWGAHETAIGAIHF